jgi:hypothetical protein
VKDMEKKKPNWKICKNYGKHIGTANYHACERCKEENNTHKLGCFEENKMKKMRYWRIKIKELKKEREMKNLKYKEEKKILIDGIISSITDELGILYEELLSDYGFKRYDPPFEGYELKDLKHGAKYQFYLWKIKLNVDSWDGYDFVYLILCGDRDYELPDSFEMESADNYNPKFKQTYHKGISPKSLRFIFNRQLANMGFQKKHRINFFAEKINARHNALKERGLTY